MKFDVIYCDCPWSYRDKRGADRGLNFGGAESHYRTMSAKDIAALPVSSIASDNSWLFMWATWPNIDVALEVIKRWDFTFKTCAFLWVKTYSGEIATNDNTAMGLGSYSRANTEPVLLATRGHVRRYASNIRQVVVSPRTRHSAKPPIIRDRIIQLAGDVPRVELFARGSLPDKWIGWGNEVCGDQNLPLDPTEWEGYVNNGSSDSRFGPDYNGTSAGRSAAVLSGVESRLRAGIIQPDLHLQGNEKETHLPISV